MNKKPEAKQPRTAWFFVLLFGLAAIIVLSLSMLAADTRRELEISTSTSESALDTLYSMERNRNTIKDIRKESETLKDILK